MSNNVILFLTSPTSWARGEMCLSNFKQLEKLGYDIITLTTSDFLPKYIYEKSKLVIHDYAEHKCEKKHYYKYFKNTGFGYFFWQSNSYHSTIFFHETHFPSLLRNTRTLIEVSKSFGYEKYFYIEDDHYINDSDFHVVETNFKLLDSNDLVIYKFDRNSPSEQYVYCSYLHFGKSDSMQRIVQNFPYTSDEFIKSDPNIFMHFYEYLLIMLINMHKYEGFKIFEYMELVTNMFKNSKLNMVYSYSNIIDDCRCNIIYDKNCNKNVFYYNANGIFQSFNLKLRINGHILIDRIMHPGNWFYLEIGDQDLNNTDVIINDKLIKSFKSLNINDVIYNGEISY